MVVLVRTSGDPRFQVLAKVLYMRASLTYIHMIICARRAGVKDLSLATAQQSARISPCPADLGKATRRGREMMCSKRAWIVHAIVLQCKRRGKEPARMIRAASVYQTARTTSIHTSMQAAKCCTTNESEDEARVACTRAMAGGKGSISIPVASA